MESRNGPDRAGIVFRACVGHQTAQDSTPADGVAVPTRER